MLVHVKLLVATALVSQLALGCGNNDHQHGDRSHSHTDAQTKNSKPKAPDRGSEGADAAVKLDLLQLELKAHAAAKSILDEACSSCHTTALAKSKKAKKALEHFVLDSYPYGGHHKAELGKSIRKVLGVDGTKATMPKDDPGSLQGKELELIVGWTKAWDRAAAAGVGHHSKSAPDGHSGHKH